MNCENDSNDGAEWYQQQRLQEEEEWLADQAAQRIYQQWLEQLNQRSMEHEMD